jgi:hypothetical protein
MSRQKSFGVALFIGLVLVVAGLPGSTAQEPKDADPSSKSVRERLRLAREVYEGSLENLRQDTGTGSNDVEHYYRWSVRWMQAERELGETRAARLAAYEAHGKRMKFWKERRAMEREEGYTTAAQVAAAEFFLLEADEWVIAAGRNESDK